ncbi:hypothetical protein GCM10027445_24660 [Amycolatopsis endophytica]|uniref:Uncharacterized protein YndB with AHSA1/START domain n=1 Tax=Amycolatopsis endophytica TaxID=860233 RepID=A0A853BCP9_9PSEU|nr:SRPBCC domain-containing protein [Amycolatopsis endophytica]NYI92441.1 uncharacterized protein YndB with AHSA1/START domain [Amycolatopsis endophytica]
MTWACHARGHLANHLKAIGREVRRTTATSGETVSVLVRRRYDATAADVWDAVTDPVRVRRWFLPLTGDLREGGTFQLEGNAGGDILTCDAPRLLKVTFGGPTSIVEVRLTADGESTDLGLEHTVPIEIAQSDAGALFVGPAGTARCWRWRCPSRARSPRTPWRPRIRARARSSAPVRRWSLP